jgi:peptidoglycan-associated lipoprotein
MSTSTWALGGLLVFGVCDVIALDALVAPRALATPAGGAPSLIVRAVAPHAIAPAAVGPGRSPVLVASASPAPVPAPVREPAPVPASREASDASPEPIPPTASNPSLDLEHHAAQIYFASDTAAIAPDASAALDQLAASLAAHSRRSIVIIGHADERGTTRHNDALSARRMRHVRDYLAVKGVAPARMSGHAVGAREPAERGTSEAALAANRRVEIRLERRSR